MWTIFYWVIFSILKIFTNSDSFKFRNWSLVPYDPYHMPLSQNHFLNLTLIMCNVASSSKVPPYGFFIVSLCFPTEKVLEEIILCLLRYMVCNMIGSLCAFGFLFVMDSSGINLRLLECFVPFHVFLAGGNTKAYRKQWTNGRTNKKQEEENIHG